jgi:hypothetical protein
MRGRPLSELNSERGTVVDVEYVHKIKMRDAVRALEPPGCHLFQNEERGDRAPISGMFIFPPGTRVPVK